MAAVSGFRQVADLGRQSVISGALVLAPAAWSPYTDGRLVYVAPTPKLTLSNPLGLPTTSGGDPAPFIAGPSAPGLTAEEGRRLGSATGLMAPEWPGIDEAGDLGILTLARTAQASKPLTLRGIDPTSGGVGNVDVVLPARVGGTGTASARWDSRHGRLLIVSPHDNSGVLDFWLMQLSGGEVSW